MSDTLQTLISAGEGFSQLSSLVPQLLVLLSAKTDISDAIFTNFSHEPTWRWYFAMTPFESFFLFLIIMQFAVLNLLGIFPLNLSQALHGMGTGRRKRDISFRSQKRNMDIASQLLKLMKKLDPDECSFKSICEFELVSASFHDGYVTNATTLPSSVAAILQGLKQISKLRRKGYVRFDKEDRLENPYSLYHLSLPGIDKSEDDVIAQYEEAVKIGGSDSISEINSTSSNSPEISPCDTKYSRCSVSRNDMLEYLSMVQSIDDFLAI